MGVTESTERDGLTETADPTSRCSICGASTEILVAREMLLGTREEFRYRFCPQCECLRIEQPPADLQRYYPADYPAFVGVRAETRSVFRDGVARWKNRLLLHSEGMAQWLHGIRPQPAWLMALALLKPRIKARILDVGCGTGSALRFLRKIGFKSLHGIDPLLPSEAVSDEPGLRIQRTTLDSLDGEYDVIMFNHSLEHMTDHEGVMERISRLLSRDGNCLIRIPVVGGIGWNRYRSGWYQLDAPRHLFLHSARSLGMLVERAGFRIRRIRWDADGEELLRSELYRRNISMKEFWNDYGGDPRRIFDEAQLRSWQREAREANRSAQGDQAAFLLERLRK